MFLLLFPYSKRRFYYNRNALFVQSAMESIRFYILIRNPCDGDTEKVAQQLIQQFGESSEDSSEPIDPEQLPESETPDSDKDVILDLPKSRSSESDNLTKVYTYYLTTASVRENNNIEAIDESQPNTGTTISLDLMKMVHHSVDYNNTTYFLTSLNPKTVVVTAPMSWYSSREKALLPNSSVYATATNSAAVVSTFSPNGITTSYVTLTPGWSTIDGKQYYFDENGRTLTKGAHTVNGKLYFFNQQGDLPTNGWVNDGNFWYYSISDSHTLAT